MKAYMTFSVRVYAENAEKIAALAKKKSLAEGVWSEDQFNAARASVPGRELEFDTQILITDLLPPETLKEIEILETLHIETKYA